MLSAAEYAWPDVLTQTAAQATALTALVTLAGWWGRRVVRWWRKARVWRRAIQEEHFAQRIGQYAAASIEPRFGQLEENVAEINRKVDQHLLESVRRRVREDDLYTRLEDHMDREDGRT